MILQHFRPHHPFIPFTGQFLRPSYMHDYLTCQLGPPFPAAIAIRLAIAIRATEVRLILAIVWARLNLIYLDYQLIFLNCGQVLIKYTALQPQLFQSKRTIKTALKVCELRFDGIKKFLYVNWFNDPIKRTRIDHRSKGGGVRRCQSISSKNSCHCHSRPKWNNLPVILRLCLSLVSPTPWMILLAYQTLIMSQTTLLPSLDYC